MAKGMHAASSTQTTWALEQVRHMPAHHQSPAALVHTLTTAAENCVWHGQQDIASQPAVLVVYFISFYFTLVIIILVLL